MPNRIVREGILDSTRVDQLSAEAEVFFRRLMSIVDDFGRFEADAFVIRGRCYIRRVDQITISQVEGWMRECERARLIDLYHVDGKRYLEIYRFGQPHRSKSKFPGKDGSFTLASYPKAAESKLTQPKSDESSRNHLLPSPNTDTDTNTHSDVLSISEEKTLLPNDSSESQESIHVSGENGDNVTPSRTFNADWFEFRDVAEQAGMSGSSVDWDSAWRIVWRYFDPAQKAAAVKGIHDRRGTDDPALSALPINYLQRRMWERAVRRQSGATPISSGGGMADVAARAKKLAIERQQRREAERAGR